MLLLLSMQAQARMIRIGVIDTGYDTNTYDIGTKICKFGHWDFTSKETRQIWDDKHTPPDNHGHGTHVAGLIHQGYVGMIASQYKNPDNALQQLPKIGNDEYCLVIIKYFDRNSGGAAPSVNALRWAIDSGVDIINFSGGGVDDIETEDKLIRQAVYKGIVVITAAGNDGQVLLTHNPSNDTNSVGEYYYPASDPGVQSVGGYKKGKKKKPTSSSNYGPNVSAWELGEAVLSTLPSGTIGIMTGTSQACAIHTGKVARQIHDRDIAIQPNKKENK
jgi:subtilisin family serine protease